MTYRTKSGLELNGEIAEDCPSHTGEKWLKILQQKSEEMGRAMPWHDIKWDPMINHCEIYDSIGAYSSYEGKLYSGKKKTQSKEETLPRELIEPTQSPTVKPRRQSRAKSRISVPTGVEPVGCLERINTPPERDWENRGVIVLAQLDEKGAEKDIEFGKLEIRQDGKRMCFADLRRCFLGIGNTCCVSEILVYPDKISLTLRWNILRLVGSSYPDHIEFQMKPGEKMTLMLCLILQPDSELRDYVLCECSDKGIVVTEPNALRSYQ